MKYTAEQLRQLFQSKFNLTDWTEFITQYLEAQIIRTEPELLEGIPSEEGQGGYLGQKNTADQYEIGLFYIRLHSSVCNRRVGLRQLVHKWLNTAFDAALVVFDDGDNWRLSFICDIKDEATAPKRYTYVFGSKELLYKTPIERFLLLQAEGISFENLKTAFSVEALSDEFFDKYREHYADFIQYITGKRFVKSGSKWEEKSLGETNAVLMGAFGSNEKSIRNYVKKMMGRITFLHFLQRKRWMCGDLNYMQNLFNRSQYQDNYLDSVLEPLFFGILNTKPTERTTVFKEYGWDTSLLNEWKDIPYLNGGLFERDETDEAECKFPADYFSRLFQFFSEYNFTIDENDPNDAEVGVDPEMLGKIFENLLEDNKDKGAFYTPKEIVRYMCQESLIAYLETETHLAEEKIRPFVISPEEGVSDIPANKKDDLLTALRDVKICDPAIGSGAFPMGLLNELLHCREVLSGEHYNRAEIKKNIIQNNIYGVDIEKGAVDIARLRFWLSIVVDEDTPSPLPNLDFKIMQGNSLLEQFEGLDMKDLLPKNDEKDGLRLLFTEEQVQNEIIRNKQEQYFKEDNHTQKTALRNEIKDAVRQLILARTPGRPDIAQKIKYMDIAANEQFFLWHTWFSDVFQRPSKQGFDIVIGNPPYGELRDLDEIQQQQNRQSKYLKYAKGGRINLFQFFYPLALDIAKDNAVISFIVQNSLLAEETTRANRKLLLDKSQIIFIDSYPERYDVNKRVFRSVTMSVCVCLVIKKATEDYTFRINVWEDKNKNNGKVLTINKSDIISLYPEALLFPSCDQESLALLVKIKSKSNFTINAQAGEIDMTKYKPYFTQDLGDIRVITGSNVANYDIDDNATSGKNVCLPKVIVHTLSRVDIRESDRIVLQRITGVNAKQRFIGGILQSPLLCANSTNYISARSNEINLLYLLGILNSRLLTYFDKLTNTNANITTKVLNSLPIINKNCAQKEQIIDIVNHIILKKHTNHCANIDAERVQIDHLVYELYGLTEQEIRIVERN